MPRWLIGEMLVSALFLVVVAVLAIRWLLAWWP